MSTQTTQARARQVVFRWLSILLLAALFLPAFPATAEEEAPAAPEITTGLTWLEKTVDRSEEFFGMSSRSLRLDNDGDAGIVYGGRKLYYARLRTSGWDVDVVDGSFGVGQYASLAYDNNERPHISYYDALNGDLMYARWFDDNWEITRVDSSGNTGLYTSIEVDDNNRPHISYYNADNQRLYYARRTSSGWEVQPVTSIAGYGRYTSLDLDNDDRPHISYYSDVDDALMYSYKDSNGIWNTTSVDIRQPSDSNLTRGLGTYTSIIVDSDRRAHISYFDGIKGDLRYARCNRTSCSNNLVEHNSGEVVGKYSSIGLDSNRNPRISYFNETNDDLKYAIWDSGADEWDVSTLRVDSEERVGSFTSLQMSGNNAFIGYYDFRAGKLRMVKRSGDKWVDSLVDSTETVGLHARMKLDSNGDPHLAYYDEKNGSLRYARWTGANWELWELDTLNDTGQYVGFDLDTNQLPHIVYYDATNKELKYIRRTKIGGEGPDWSAPEVVDSDGDVGKYASLVVDSNNYLHVSYLDATRRYLRYAFKASNTWSIHVVDNTGDVGYFTAIAVDSSNIPHIAYFDDTEGRDRPLYATLNPGLSTWSREVIQENPQTGSRIIGYYLSLAIDPTNNIPHVAYYSYWNNGPDVLQYATRASGSWQSATVDQNIPPSLVDESLLTLAPASVDAIQPLGDLPGVGLFTGIALDSTGRPHISYLDHDNGDLKYAYCNGVCTATEGWQKSVVSARGDVGYYTSVALRFDDQGNELPIISYFDNTTRALKTVEAAILENKFFLPFTAASRR